ncbi:MAG: LacI family DNA-binding transcriptional regulator [Planctomycetota bacterium]
MSTKKRTARIGDVARCCAVSVTTVSRVLNNRQDVSPETRAKVERAIRRLGYVPSAAARRMASGRPHAAIPTQTIAILTNPALAQSVAASETLSALTVKAAGTGYRVVVVVTPLRQGRDGCDGFVMMGRYETEALADHPKVTMDWLSPDPTIPGVLPDYEAGIYQAAKVALARGYRRPFLLAGCPKNPEMTFSGMLWRGYRRALIEEGHAPEACVCQTPATRKEEAYQAALEILRRPDRPDLIFTNDDGGIGVYRAARELGIAIPSQLGVVGCDGLSLCPYMTPSLATIEIGFEALAAETLNRLWPAINRTPGPHPSKLLLKTKFTDGDSLLRGGT